MELWDKIWPVLVDPFRYLIDHNERIYFGYLASSFALGIGVYFAMRWREPGSVPGSIFAYLFPRRIYLHKSAVADYEFFLVDRILYVLLFPVLAFVVTPISDTISGALTQQFGTNQHPLQAGSGWILLASTLAQILWMDFMLFYVHYLFHKVPALWEFHKVHHSAEVMTPITAYRVHPVELFATMNVTALGSGVLIGLIGYLTGLTGGQRPELTIVGINVVQFAFYVVGFNLRHSHIPLHYGSVLGKVFVSPWMHQVHHSREPRHFDKNMGFIFSFWDWIFGTLYVPKPGEQFELGLADGEHVRFHSVPALYFRPFTNLMRRWWKPAKVA
ncbi:MAG TPA: sterol desaturase family protein [Candidatus Cybelea sp.]|nr:sterol desaturase family protein [Candidatus Cybelea sp.]